MAEFEGMALTDLGRNLLAKAQAGATLEITRVGVGSGEWPEAQSPEGMAALINEEQSLALQGVAAAGGGVTKVTAVISNTGLESGYFLRELGVFAMDPDLGEILYACAYAGDKYDFVPAEGHPIEKVIDILIITGSAQSVSATIDDTLMLALKSDIKDHDEDSASHASHAARIKANRARLDMLFGGGAYLLETFLAEATLIAPLDVTVTTIAGSDVITCNDTSGLTVGMDYVIKAGTVAERVEIAEIVNSGSARAASDLANSFADASMTRCSLDVDWNAGVATAADGDVYLAGPVSLGDADSDKTILLNQDAALPAPSIYFIDNDNPDWTACTLVLTRSAHETDRNELAYTLPARGAFSLRIEPGGAGDMYYLAVHADSLLQDLFDPRVLYPLAHYTLDGVTDIADVYDAATGIFTPPAEARFVEFILVGGGGGGNLSADRTRTCGGASGAVCKVRVPVTAGDAYTVSIGAGGAGATSNTGNSGGDTLVTGPGAAWTATAGGGDGGEPSTSGLRNGGAVTCTGIFPVVAMKGIDNYALCEINTTDSDAWINAGSSAPGMGTCALAPYGVAPGQGGFARSTESPSGYAGGDGVVYVTVY